ncbi:MAG: UDP-N-acetylmuramoyl-tripeptide--D-alanyl-D-alanine ligase [Desulfobacteraceae bacterium]|nr:UDP-N-acetylmuramoyl-tripeptide--D-alanyl-D-alanine ligase [Desulfobacteraceae bacterium]
MNTRDNDILKWSTKDLLQATGGELLYGTGTADFTGIGIDSRTISTGELYVAVIGEVHDGHRFAADVVQKGIKGLIIGGNSPVDLPHDRWRHQDITCIRVADTIAALGRIARWHRQRYPVKVVAITGSNGKTTTREMTGNVVGHRYRTLSSPGNFNNEIGLPLSLFRLRERHEAAVLELGMNRPGEIGRLGRICRPDIGVITNVGPVHLEFLGSIENVARAKGELLETVRDGGTVVLNADDPYVSGLLVPESKNRLTFGFTETADIRAQHIEAVGNGNRFELVMPSGTVTVHLESPGKYMIYNALAAAAAGFLLDVAPDGIQKGLEAFSPIKGRMRIIETANGLHVIDDTYNANPVSMQAALENLTAMRGKSRGFAVLGDMLELGKDAGGLHEELGAMAVRTGIYGIYATGDYAPAVARGAKASASGDQRIFTGTKPEITEQLVRDLSGSDWLLVKGSRGMAMETIVDSVLTWADQA